jgi:histidyl-tRNA synthetase
LRYDQTVPSARILYQYQNELPKFFRRYQIQNVYRADKPQQGRYREFVQADCDIFGAPEPLADAEILSVVYTIYSSLGLQDAVLEYNDRRLLSALLSPFSTSTVSFASLTQSIDKLDKTPRDVVVAELQQKGLTSESVVQIFQILDSAVQNDSLTQIVQIAGALGVPAQALRFNPYLARGLDYYTGLILEVKVPGGSGSIGAGGRYDNLIEQLSGMPMSAVGFAVGFDRTIELLRERGLLPTTNQSTKILVTVFSPSLLSASLQLAAQLRTAGIQTELYPTFDRLGKQLRLADQKQIPFAAIIGEEEQSQGIVKIRNMKTGEEISQTAETVSQTILTGG